MKGKLIVFEGLDYSFKETNSIKLEHYINSNITNKVLHFSFPNYHSPSSFFIKEYLAGAYGNASYIDPYKASYCYSLDRMDSIIKLEINKLLEKGWYIIFDRYIGSNLTFQTAKVKEIAKHVYNYRRMLYGIETDLYKLDYEKVPEYDKYYKMDYNIFKKEYNEHDFIQNICKVEYFHLDLPKEDLCIFMDMPIDISYELMQKRKLKTNGKKDEHENNYNFMKLVEESSKTVIDIMGYEVVKCTDNNSIRTEEEIFNDILTICEYNNIFK